MAFQLVLASGSPRRAELLRQIGIPFLARASHEEENFLGPDTAPFKHAVHLALRKAKAVQKRHPEAFILGADTMVVCGKKVMGKPADAAKAEEMLRMLSGRTHRVITGLAVVYKKRTLTAWCETKVTFCRLKPDFISRYVRSGEPMDKAGAYGIQGLGSLCIRRIEGDFFNVVGLPLVKLRNLLEKIGFFSRRRDRKRFGRP